MTQIYITIGVISIVAVLVCYVFIRQTMSDKRQEKERLHRALAKRAKELLHILSVFPADFLPQELRVFIYRCIIDAYQQLTKLKPNHKEYIEALKVQSTQLEATIRTPDIKKTVTIQSATQINECRQYLTLLGRFLQRSLQRNTITQKQYGHYRALVKNLNARLAVDAYTISAKRAVEMDKPRLAIHYYNLAKDLLTKETPTGYQEQIVHINLELEPLMAEEAQQQAIQANEANEPQQASTSSQPTDSNEGKEWAQFEEEADWKKKNIYD